MIRTNLYLDPEKLRALKMVAASESSNVSELVREAIDGIIRKRVAMAKARSANGSTARLATTLLDDVLQRVDEGRPAEISQDEIDRDVADAVSEVRTKRAARRRSAASGPTVGDP